LEIVLGVAALPWASGDAWGGQPGEMGVWLVQFVLLFLDSSSKGHRSCHGVIHSCVVKIALL